MVRQLHQLHSQPDPPNPHPGHPQLLRLPGHVQKSDQRQTDEKNQRQHRGQTEEKGHQVFETIL